MSSGSSKISFSSIHMGKAEPTKKPQIQSTSGVSVHKRQAVTLPVTEYVPDEEAEALLPEPVAPAYAAAGLFAATPQSGQNVFQRNAVLFAGLMIVVLTILLGISTSLLLSSDKRQAVISEFTSTRIYSAVRGDGPANTALQFYGKPSAFERILEGNIGTLQSPDKIQVGQRLIIPS